jgi:carboxyl-terminal processing protease
MKNTLFRTFAAVIILLSTISLSVSAKLESNRKLETIAQLTATIISNRHYSQQQLNDDVSKKLFNEYLKTIDPGKIFFTAPEVQKLSRYQYSLDDQILLGKLDFAFLVFDMFLDRYREYCDFSEKQLKKGFDFTIDENFQFDRSEADWPANEAEMHELWRKRLKNNILTQKLMLKAMQENGSDQKDAEKAEKYKKLWGDRTPEQKVEKHLKQTLADLESREAIDVVSDYLSSLTKIYDPHSSYMSPAREEAFNIAMKLSLVGIGAVLVSEDGFTKIVSIIPGGPAERDGRLKPEDRIIAVAQENEEPVDIIDMPLNKVVQLIRGEKDTKVYLTVLPGDKGRHAIPQLITITRNTVELKEQEAAGKIETFKGEDGKERKVGVITLPSFYMDFAAAQSGDPNYKSSTNDVANILKDFNKQGVDGIVLDMRSNGGGSLLEAIKLTGLFITGGPVVQIKDSLGRIMVQEDPDQSVLYSGPMVVLVNKLSASATEIFAGAIKDYNRGVIVGDSHTHGKGTVQTVSVLKDMLSVLGVSFDAGSIKFTNAKFYRINGHSTQLKGVEPHIVLPSFTDYMEIGETHIDYALPWDAIKPVKYISCNNRLDGIVKDLKQKSASRISKAPQFEVLKNEIEAFKLLTAKKEVSLNKATRWAEYLKEKKFKEQQENIVKLNRAAGSEDNADKAAKEDIFLKESMNVLIDFIELNKTNNDVAVSQKMN